MLLKRNNNQRDETGAIATLVSLAKVIEPIVKGRLNSNISVLLHERLGGDTEGEANFIAATAEELRKAGFGRNSEKTVNTFVWAYARLMALDVINPAVVEQNRLVGRRQRRIAQGEQRHTHQMT